jgi:hypothetical protein
MLEHDMQHEREIERVLSEIEAAWERAEEAAMALDREGAPVELVGALRETTATLAAERSRFDAIARQPSAQPELDERQQRLAV